MTIARFNVGWTIRAYKVPKGRLNWIATLRRRCGPRSMSQEVQSSVLSQPVHKTARYVLITPARNEAAFIELTLKSMTAQTVKPLKWVIVSDGSTDGTDEIVNRYAAANDWIEL